VTEYLKEAGLTESLEALHFNLVGYGCTTCIGNSGPLPDVVSKQIEDGKLVVAAVLSGNRNFEGRVHAEVRANYLASPPLVVAYALAGRVDLDLTTETARLRPRGRTRLPEGRVAQPAGGQGRAGEVRQDEQFRHVYEEVFTGDEHWAGLQVPTGELYAWDDASTYVSTRRTSRA